MSESTTENRDGPSERRGALERWGAFLLKPQRTLTQLTPDEGKHDGLLVGLLYVLGSQLISVGQAIKSLLVVWDLNALMMLASQLGRIALPPLVLILLVEFLVGPSKSHRAGLFLLPLVVVATGANLARQLGSGLHNEMTPILIGAGWSLLLVLLCRSSIVPLPAAPLEDEATTTPAGGGS